MTGGHSAGTCDNFRADARAGRTLAWAVTLDGRLVGQVTAAGITMGSLRGASIGYWIDSRVAGLGLTPMAVAMVPGDWRSGMPVCELPWC